MAQQSSNGKELGLKEAPYELLYHPGIPGRGEFIRLVFEATGTSYRDVGNESEAGLKTVYATCTGNSLESSDGNPPVFAPPALRVAGAGRNGNPLVISQTSNLLLFLGRRLNLVPSHDEGAQYHTHQVALTALDFSNEIHDGHHPLAVSKTYEEQSEAAKSRTEDLRTSRMPKFFSYFERTLQANGAAGKGKYLVGSSLTYADTTVWQVIDGLFFAFPREMAARQREFPALLEDFYDGIKSEPWLQAYLASDRRLSYGNGLFRHYPELDRA